MSSRRLVLTFTKKLADFLDEMAKETGIDDHRDLVRWRIWRWSQEERDRRIAEGRIAMDLVLPAGTSQRRHLRKPKVVL